MPSIYAHKKFGALVYKALPVDVREIIADGYESFLVGLHGPDTHFFHNPGMESEVQAIGSRMHKECFKNQYERALSILNEKDDNDRMAYFLGCICHYISDSACHPLVSEAMESTGMSHGKIETELERYILLTDGHNPMTYPTSAHLPVNMEVAEAASVFYPGVSSGEFLSALAAMKAAYKICRLPQTGIRNGICKIMEATGNEKKIASLLMSRQKSNMAYPHVKAIYEMMISQVSEAADEIVRFARYYDENPEASDRLCLDYNGNR